MKYLNPLFYVLILVVIVAVLFLQRQIFFYRYEPEYYENWYYHSQWNYPDSTRGISDGELYKFVGYRLIEGENPFNINFEMPPFGKSLYGLGEMCLGNPYWVTILLYLSSIVFLFLCSRELFEDRQLILLLILLFVTTPFIATQLRETMLDLPMMLMYLVHVWFFIKFLSNQKLPTLITSGIFLGLATGTKPGVYTPLTLVLGLFLVLLTTKKILDLIFYSGSVFAGYILAYFTYFMRHPNPIPWLRLHEKPLRFYLRPGIQADYLKQWRLIFFNYQEWWPFGQKIALGGGTLILPLGVVALIIILIWAIKRRHKQWIYITGLSSIFLIVNTFIPFFPRYLMPTIPLFVLLIAFLFRRIGWVILLLSVINLPFLLSNLSTEDPSGDMQVAARFISTRAYRELYRSVMSPQRENIPEENFINLCETFLEGLGTRAIEVEVGEMNQSPKRASVKYKIKYTTKYGELIHEPTIDYIKSDNQWRIFWHWDYLWPGYTPESKIVANEETIPLLRLENQEGTIIAKRGQWKTVYVIPRVMFDWNKHLKILSEVTGESTEAIDKRIRQVTPDHYPRFVGYLDPALGEEGINKALSIPGVNLQDIDYPVIIENDASAENVAEIIRDICKKRPELFYVQAEVYLEDDSGNKVLIPFEEAEQKNVVIRI
jgi:hypothetical protein